MEYSFSKGTKISSRIHRKSPNLAQSLKYTLQKYLVPAKQQCQAFYFIYWFKI